MRYNILSAAATARFVFYQKFFHGRHPVPLWYNSRPINLSLLGLSLWWVNIWLFDRTFVEYCL